MYGLDKIITHKTGISTIIAEDAISCVAVGTGKFIEYAVSGKVEFTKDRIQVKRRRV